MRAGLRLTSDMVKRGFAIMVAVSLLALPFLTASVHAGGCCGTAGDHKAKASDGAPPRKCCCGDASACDCHLSEDDAAPSAEIAPAPAEPDLRACLLASCAVSTESFVPYQDEPFPTERFTYARAPASDIVLLNHTFLC